MSAPMTPERETEIRARLDALPLQHPPIVADARDLLAEVARLRAEVAELDSALVEALTCSCGYGTVCGECHTRHRQRAERAEADLARVTTDRDRLRDGIEALLRERSAVGAGIVAADDLRFLLDAEGEA